MKTFFTLLFLWLASATFVFGVIFSLAYGIPGTDGCLGWSGMMASPERSFDRMMFFLYLFLLPGTLVTGTVAFTWRTVRSMVFGSEEDPPG